MKQVLLIEDVDQLKILIKECLIEVLTEFIPYCSPNENLKLLYTRNELAALLQVSPNTISRFIKQGKLHGTVLNGKFRFSRKNVELFLKSEK